MKRLFAVLGLLTLSTCASEGPPRLFDNNDLELALGNAARLSCTCLFVMEMPEPYCRAWVKARPDIASFSPDYTAKTVTSSSFIAFSARARFIDARRGCILE